MQELSIVIVSWNTRGDLGECLRSIEAQAPGAEVIVVDNASEDGSAELVKEDHPNVTLLRNAQNVGFAPAANRGAGAASGSALCFLNSDTVIGSDGLAPLLEYLATEAGTGAVGPRIVLGSGETQVSYGRYPTFATELVHFGLNVFRMTRNPVTTWKDMGTVPPQEPAEVDWLSGCCLVVPGEVFEEAGGFDDAYFAYYEDTSLCRKIKSLGYRVAYVPTSTVVHKEGSSYRNVPGSRRILDSLASSRTYFLGLSSPSRVSLYMAAVSLTWRMHFLLLCCLDTLLLGRHMKVHRKRGFTRELVQGHRQIHKTDRDGISSRQ